MKPILLGKGSMALAVTAMLFLSSTFSAAAQGRDINSQVNKFGQTMYYLQNHYLDTINLPKLVDKVLAQAISELDPHSVYIPAKEVQAMNEPIEGNFEGIGVEFGIIQDTLVVVAPVAGGPSESVGIRAADRIIAVNDTVIAKIGLTNQRVFALLRGPKGSKVRLTVLRKGSTEPLQFELTRDKIPIHSVDAAYEALPDIAYLRLSRFALSSMDEFIDAFSKFQRMPQGVILDLRGNSGGSMGTALQITEQFLSKGQLVVYTEGAHMPKREEKASGNGFFINTPVIVLIDEESASASEILAGALQDWDRAILIGRRSFGKGLVQQGLPLADGAQIRLTIARYHTPTGRVIQSPYHLGDKEGYYKAVIDRYIRGEQFSKDSIHLIDSLKYKTLKTGRAVYGGGGIMPDIFVAQDTMGYTPYWGKMIRMGIVTEFMSKYIDEVRSGLSKYYKSLNEFKAQYVVPEEAVESLVSFAEQKSLPRSPEDLQTSLPVIRLQMKALVARTLFDSGAYYQIINEGRDPVYAKALEVMKNWKQYEQQLLQ